MKSIILFGCVISAILTLTCNCGTGSEHRVKPIDITSVLDKLQTFPENQVSDEGRGIGLLFEVRTAIGNKDKVYKENVLAISQGFKDKGMAVEILVDGDDPRLEGTGTLIYTIYNAEQVRGPDKKVLVPARIPAPGTPLGYISGNIVQFKATSSTVEIFDIEIYDVASSSYVKNQFSNVNDMVEFVATYWREKTK